MSTPNFALYYAALAADDAYQRACVAEHGPVVGRWAIHLHPETIAACDAKHAADAAWLAEMRRAQP